MNRSSILSLAALIALVVSSSAVANQQHDVEAAGSGVYIPSTGYFYGTGDGTLLGVRYFTGIVETKQIGPTTLAFENKGRGTDDETFQEIITTDGSSLSLRFQGTVELTLQDDGFFTAVWKGEFEIVRGTGTLRGARGTLDVVATNSPFKLDDPAWQFDWIWEGQVRTKRRALRAYSVLTTEGLGAFDPANLGVGDPNVLPFPIVIGDGSGLAVYDGTPTGTNYRLDGILVASGEDQHFGTAQSLTSGIPVGAVVQYPGTEEDDADGPNGKNFHRMVTDIGEIWLQKEYYFELDPAEGTLVAPVHFRIIGGTGLYRRAKGSIFCFVSIDLADIGQGSEGQVVAPFHYDFDGYVEFTPINRFILRILQLKWIFG